MANIGDAAQSTGDIMRRLRELERFVQELAAARKLENATIGKGGIRVDAEGLIRSTTFDGNLAADNPGTAGWALGADRLVLGGQFVTPLGFGRGDERESDFAITTTQVARAEAFIDVPSWATEAIVFSGHVAQGLTDEPSGDYLTIQGEIDGSGGQGANFLAFAAGASAAGTVVHNRLLTSLGTRISIATRLNSTAGSWGASSVNFASSTAIALFTRGV